MQGLKQKESNLVKNVIKIINSLPYCKAYKRHAGPFQKGRPDITGSVVGFRLELEGKLPGNKPTPIQSQHLKDWIDAGCASGWFNTKYQAIAIIYDYLSYMLPQTCGVLYDKISETIYHIEKEKKYLEKKPDEPI